MNEHEQMVEWCKAYLADQHTVLWGQTFDLISGDLDAAAEWLAGEIEAVGRHSGNYS